MGAHLCHAWGCQTEINPHLFMCLKHWKMLPRFLQKEIWHHYRPGQEEDKQPSQEYREVARVCKEVISIREVLPDPEGEYNE